MRRSLGIALSVAVLTGFWGCGAGGPRLVNVTGTVTANDEPLEGAEVVFVPDPASKDGQMASDITGPEGNYKLMTHGRAGLVPGKYKVIITKSLIDTLDVPEEFKDDPYMIQLAAETAAMEQGRAKGGNAPPPPTEVKSEYDREIPAEDSVQDFDLKVKISSR